MRASTEVAELRESKSRPEAGIITFSHELTNQRNEVVCRCLRSALLKRKS
jgi:acyl dehydratase